MRVNGPVALPQKAQALSMRDSQVSEHMFAR
jgi:hypothetical protein